MIEKKVVFFHYMNTSGCIYTQGTIATYKISMKQRRRYNGQYGLWTRLFYLSEQINYVIPVCEIWISSCMEGVKTPTFLLETLIISVYFSINQLAKISREVE